MPAVMVTRLRTVLQFCCPSWPTGARRQPGQRFRPPQWGWLDPFGLRLTFLRLR